MARTNTDSDATPAATRQVWQRARQAAQDAKPVVAQVKPLASDTKDAAARGLLKARAWAAPQVEHTGQVLQDSVAPKVAAALTSTAQRLEPDKAAPHAAGARWPGSPPCSRRAAAIVIALRNRIAASTPAAADEDEPVPLRRAGGGGRGPRPPDASPGRPQNMRYAAPGPAVHRARLLLRCPCQAADQPVRRAVQPGHRADPAAGPLSGRRHRAGVPRPRAHPGGGRTGPPRRRQRARRCTRRTSLEGVNVTARPP